MMDVESRTKQRPIVLKKELRKSDHFTSPLFILKANLVESALKGDEGDIGQQKRRGPAGPAGSRGSQGFPGAKGQRGHAGNPGHDRFEDVSAFSVLRWNETDGGFSGDFVSFDITLANSGRNPNIQKGRFQCSTSGIYFFNFNIHTWGRRETYMHLLLNGSPRVVLFAQADFRGIMQSQSVLLSVRQGDEVSLKLHTPKSSDKTRTVLNGIFSHKADVSITFNGHLVAPMPG
uniref:complement C1q tumor necrosis factor-related protein 1-like isoform X2 n=1 Tax=Myxine glutinosa TaxID=7769 RepID=UPI00358F4ABB